MRPYNYAWPRTEDQRGEQAALKAMEVCGDILIDLAKDLTRLTFFGWEGTELPCDRVWHALRVECPQLQGISANIGVRGAWSKSLYAFTNLTDFSVVVPELEGVDKNWFPIQVELSPSLWEMLHDRCPNLERLAITSRSPYVRSHDFSPIVLGHWPQLKSLTVGPFGHYMGYAGTVGPRIHHDARFVSFLARHSRLEELNLVWELRTPLDSTPPFVPFTRPLASEALPNLKAFTGIWQQLQALPNLTQLEALNLTCEPLVESRFDEVAHIIERLPNLLSLTIEFDSVGHRQRDSGSRSLFKVISSSCPKLEELDLICHSQEHEGPTKHLLMELEELTNLRSLSLTRGFKTSAKLLDTAVWLTKSLSTLEKITLRWAKKRYPCGIKQVCVYKVRVNPETQLKTLDVDEMGSASEIAGVVGLNPYTFTRKYRHKV